MRMTAIALDWSQAHVTAAGTELGLRVPLTGRPDAHWLAEFESLRVSRHLQVQGTGWTVESVDEANEVFAKRLVPGDEATIREALDDLIALAGERAAEIRAEEEAERQRVEEELARAQQDAAEMTQRFRSLEPLPPRAQAEAVEQPPESSAFQDRLRRHAEVRATVQAAPE